MKLELYAYVYVCSHGYGTIIAGRNQSGEWGPMISLKLPSEMMRAEAARAALALSIGPGVLQLVKFAEPQLVEEVEPDRAGQLLD